jgi:transposase-like protein
MKVSQKSRRREKMKILLNLFRKIKNQTNSALRYLKTHKGNPKETLKNSLKERPEATQNLKLRNTKVTKH